MANPHVMPLPMTNLPRAEDVGFVSWNYDVVSATNTQVLTAGTIYLTKLFIRQPRTIQNVYFWMPILGSGTSTATCWAGLYGLDGTRLGQLDISGSLGTTGLKTFTMPSSYDITDGAVWTALVTNLSTTQPTFARMSGSTGVSTVINGIKTAPNVRYALGGTSQTTLPASFTPASLVTTATATLWTAVS